MCSIIYACTNGLLDAVEVVLPHLLGELLHAGDKAVPQVGGDEAEDVVQPGVLQGGHVDRVDPIVDVVEVALYM